MDERIIKLRQQIDEIDENILSLLKERMEISAQVGELKSELDVPIEDSNREKMIIERLTQHAEGTLTEEQLIRIFTLVFKSSKQVQK